jgi:pimeloyl-ACP methyl ester carboxylesterase
MNTDFFATFNDGAIMLCTCSHGLGSNRKVWRDVTDVFIERGYPTCALDLRGHGANEVDQFTTTPLHQTRSEFSMEASSTCIITAIEFLREVNGESTNISEQQTCLRGEIDGENFPNLRKSEVTAMIPCQWRERVIIVGHSYGGNVALYCAANDVTTSPSNFISGVVCIEGGYINLRKSFPDYTNCMSVLSPPTFFGVKWDELENMVREQWCKGQSVHAVEAMLYSFRRLRNDLIESKLPHVKHMQLLRDLWERSPTQLYPQVQVPVLFLAAGDPSASYYSLDKRADVAEALECIRGSRVIWYESHGHNIPSEAPNEAAEDVISAINDGFLTSDARLKS